MWRIGRTCCRAAVVAVATEYRSFVQAAALPCAYGTALRMMGTNGHVAAGERVLILGASGGVGVCCVQLAKPAGAHVIACAGGENKAERLRQLGADETIDYTRTDFATEVYARFGKPTRRGEGGDNGVDVVVNFIGGDTWVRSLRCPRVGGRADADLRRHRRLRPDRGYPLHLDLRAEDTRLQWLGQGRHHDVARDGPKRGICGPSSTKAFRWSRHRRPCGASRIAKSSARSW